MFCTSTLVLFEVMSAVPNTAAFRSFLKSCCPGTLLRSFLNDFEMVPIAPIITGSTFIFTLHVRCIYIIIIIIIIIIIHSSVQYFPLRTFTLALSDDSLYVTYTTEFPLSGPDSRVILPTSI